MSKYASKRFWTDTADRAISTTAQALAAGLAVTTVSGLLDVAWIPVLSAAALAGLASLLQSVAIRGREDPAA